MQNTKKKTFLKNNFVWEKLSLIKNDWHRRRLESKAKMLLYYFCYLFLNFKLFFWFAEYDFLFNSFSIHELQFEEVSHSSTDSFLSIFIFSYRTLVKKPLREICISKITEGKVFVQKLFNPLLFRSACQWPRLPNSRKTFGLWVDFISILAENKITLHM